MRKLWAYLVLFSQGWPEAHGASGCPSGIRMSLNFRVRLPDLYPN